MLKLPEDCLTLQTTERNCNSKYEEREKTNKMQQLDVYC